jgi:hypothetical protein
VGALLGEGREHGPAGLDTELLRHRRHLLGEVQVHPAHRADDVRGPVTQQPLRALVEERDHAGEARREDGVGRRRGQHLVVVVALGAHGGGDCGRVAGLGLGGRDHARRRAAEHGSAGPPHPACSGHGGAPTIMVSPTTSALEARG